MKVIKKIVSASADASAIVLFDADYEEFRVELRVKGRHQKAADYFTDDRKDALGTAAAMLARHEPATL
ncbi:MAG: hypothetical protein ACRC1H_10025 [Caldilineaceae bacterium]